MAASAVIPKHIFGLRGDAKDNVHYVDEAALVYPAGHNIVIHNLESKQQQFMPLPAESEGLLGLALTPNRRFLAVTERAEKSTVTIYDLQTLKRRKVLASVDIGGKEIASIAFSSDSKILAAQGSPVNQILFAPGSALDGSIIISAVGHGIFKTYRYQENALKPMPTSMAKREAQNYTCHAWLVEGDQDRILVGTDRGEVLVVVNGDVRGSLLISPSTVIGAIIASPKGFAVGSTGGVVTLCEREQDDRLFKIVKQLTIEGSAQNVGSLVLSPAEDTLIASMDNNQMYSLKLVTNAQADDMALKLVEQQYHCAEITGADACVRRPVVATCALDRTLRIWHVHDRTSELVKQFMEEPFSVALHPGGYSVLVGFPDKLRLFTILMDNLKLMRELPVKICTDCRFSNGGHMFAAASGNNIFIYTTYTCDLIGTLRGHNGKVRSLFWSMNDALLTTAGSDGAVYQWKLKNFKRAKENVLKGCMYNCAVATADSQRLYATSSDRKIKELEEIAGTGMQITRELDTDCMLVQLVLPPGGKTLYAGTDTGCIRAYKLPLSGEHQEVRCFSSAVTRLRLSNDDSLLYATSAAGDLFVFDVKDRDPVRSVAKRDQGEKMAYADDVLLPKVELDEKKQRIVELEGQVRDVTLQNEYNMRLKDVALADRIKELSDKHAAASEEQQAKFDQLQLAKFEKEVKFEHELREAVERHQAQLAALDDQYQAKVLTEIQRYEELVREKDALNARWDEQTQQLIESHEHILQEVTDDFTAKLQEDAELLDQMQVEKEDIEKSHEEIRRQMEEDTDREIEEMKHMYESKLAAEIEMCMRLRGENGIMKKKFDGLQSRIDKQLQDCEKLTDHEQDLQKVISTLERNILELKQQMMERNDIIEDKEKRILDLKRNNQELEKFKVVLEHKIEEFKTQIVAREAEVTSTKDFVMAVEKMLREMERKKINLEVAIGDLRQKLNSTRTEVAQKEKALRTANRTIMGFQHDLEALMEHIQNPKVLKEHVRKLHEAHGAAPVDAVVLDDSNIEDLQRQQKALEKTLEGLRTKAASEHLSHKAEKVRLVQENALLIQEVNDLREQLLHYQHLKH
ncbi:hypothetical protein WJX75_003504 [Coccomyxa subellipsoidea]|uniref:WD40 repeat-like protein n=1 Tax=Coccomyxa subellipsoidea TaxID=248742 RepID=A0ABR2YTM8_9CHLO